MKVTGRKPLPQWLDPKKKKLPERGGKANFNLYFTSSGESENRYNKRIIFYG